MKRLKSKSGMTLTELLCGIVVLLLITSLLTVGVRFAVKTYRTSMASAQAQTLCSTLTTAITDKLRYCGNVSASGDRIFIKDVGSVSGDEESGGVFRIEDGEVLLGSRKLLGSKAYPEGLRVDELKLAYAEESRTFSVSFVVTDSGGKELAKSDFQVQKINLNQS